MTLQMDVGLGFATYQPCEICKICVAKQTSILQERKTGIRLILGGCEKGISSEGMRWELQGLGENAGECKEVEHQNIINITEKRHCGREEEDECLC